MARVILAVLLGAVVHFCWGYVSHGLLGLHNSTFGEFKDQDAVMTMLHQQVKGGEKAYFFPATQGYSEGVEPNEAMTKMYAEKRKAGPTGVVLYNDMGSDAMGKEMLATGFLLELVATVFVVFVLVLTLGTRQTYLQRVLVVVMMGLFAAVTRDLMFWNWMSYPFYYSIINAADTVIGWTAAGLLIAVLVKPDVPKTV